MRPFNCCHNCEDRVVGCHSTCKKYIEDKLKNDEIRKKEQNDRIIKRCLHDSKVNRIKSMRKWRNKLL